MRACWSPAPTVQRLCTQSMLLLWSPCWRTPRVRAGGKIKQDRCDIFKTYVITVPLQKGMQRGCERFWGRRVSLFAVFPCTVGCRWSGMHCDGARYIIILYIIMIIYILWGQVSTAACLPDCTAGIVEHVRSIKRTASATLLATQSTPLSSRPSMSRLAQQLSPPAVPPTANCPQQSAPTVNHPQLPVLTAKYSLLPLPTASSPQSHTYSVPTDSNCRAGACAGGVQAMATLSSGNPVTAQSWPEAAEAPSQPSQPTVHVQQGLGSSSTQGAGSREPPALHRASPTGPYSAPPQPATAGAARLSGPATAGAAGLSGQQGLDSRSRQAASLGEHLSNGVPQHPPPAPSLSEGLLCHSRAPTYSSSSSQPLVSTLSQSNQGTGLVQGVGFQDWDAQQPHGLFSLQKVWNVGMGRGRGGVQE